MLPKAYVRFVRDTVDSMVESAEGEFPVMAETLVKVNVANWKELNKLEEEGHIKSIEVEVPSILKPGQVVKQKAYYTERNIPRLVEEMGAERLL